MSREQFIPPSLSQPGVGPSSSSSQQQQAAGTGTATFNVTGSSTYDDSARPVQYLCGDCDAKVVLKKGEAVRCKECGYRVLYKERSQK